LAKNWAKLVEFKKMPTVSDRPNGEQSPNLVTLSWSQASNKAKTGFSSYGAAYDMSPKTLFLFASKIFS
jgi:hypothetical protein